MPRLFPSILVVLAFAATLTAAALLQGCATERSMSHADQGPPADIHTTTSLPTGSE
jgi:hypothetical protein